MLEMWNRMDEMEQSDMSEQANNTPQIPPKEPIQRMPAEEIPAHIGIPESDQLVKQFQKIEEHVFDESANEVCCLKYFYVKSVCRNLVCLSLTIP